MTGVLQNKEGRSDQSKCETRAIRKERDVQKEEYHRKKLELIRSVSEFFGFALWKYSADYTQSKPLEGYEAEWKKAKEVMEILPDIYKRLETDQFCPEQDGKERLYDIIACILQDSLSIHVDVCGENRWKVTLLGVPQNHEFHGIEIIVEGKGSHKSVISHSFF